MSVVPGTRLGPYEIVSPLGVGGMGEVYRAKDTRLDRNVAIKILPAEFAADEQLRLRFEREAKTISQLEHPHICRLYDVGREDGTDFLVMELLEGETLADYLWRGPMAVEEVLRYGIQIAEALDKAHRQGVVHRDLKPGNVMLTKSGVKLLDFGLAKSLGGGPALLPAQTNLATAQKPLTQEGTIVGTFQYMAPEQLEGIEADVRSDIFAFGALLYEMATGRRAFEGKTRTSLIAAIVTGRPTPVSQVQPLAPPALEHVIERCLEKDPGDRWQSAHDVAEELKWISAKGSQIGIAAPIAAHRRRRERLSWSLYPLIALAAAGITWGVFELRKEKPRVVQTAILPPEKAQFALDQGGAPAISSDGKLIAFSATAQDGRRMLWVRPLSGGAAQPLSGTDDGQFPFWSPDSRMIGFFAGGKLKKIDASGGPAQALCDAPVSRGGSWSPEGVILFAPTTDSGIYKVSDAGGVATAVTEIDLAKGETSHRWPAFLPDGRRFVYLVVRAASGPDETNGLFVSSIREKLKKQLALASSSFASSPTGHLIYWRDRTLVAQRLDPKTLTLGRDVIPIAENVARTTRLDAFFSISANGSLVYQSGSGLGSSQLAWFDTAGKQIDAFGKPADYIQPALSHDGRRVAVSIVDPGKGRGDIWIVDLGRGTSMRLTFDPADEFYPVWSPDDSRIVYTSNAKSGGDIMMKRSSGTGAEDVIYANPLFTVATDWSPDGKTILFQEQNTRGRTDWDIWLYSLESHTARIFLQTPFAETGSKFSPDGRWIAYTSNESGKQQIYVLPVSGNGGKWQISTDGGNRVRWSRDGRQLYYVSPDYKLMAVDVTTRGDEFVASVPRVLFPINMKRAVGHQYDIAADGKRFLVNTPVEQTEIAPITLVQNWTAMLKR